MCIYTLQITEPEFPKVKLSEQIDKFSLHCFLFITFSQTVLQKEKERKNIIYEHQNLNPLEFAMILWEIIVPVNL